MIGTLDPTQKKVTVIGAGISGLLIAYALKKRGFDVQVFEAASEVGGLIHTLETPFGMVERAAHSLLITPEAQEFFNELRVELLPVNKKSRARFIYRDGKMRNMPLRTPEIFRTIISFFSKPKISFDSQNDSLETWGNSYLGEAATRNLLAPFVTGIFAASPKELLASLAFPRLVPSNPNFSLFQHFRNGKKSPRPKMMTPKNGMSAVILALQTALKENIHTESSITEIPATGNVIVSTPTSALSKLIRKKDSASAEALLKVRYAPLITATCFFHQNAFDEIPNGVGVLIPRGEGLRILGCLFNSSSFSGRTSLDSFVSLTVMMGGTEDSSALNLSDEEIRNLINQELRTLLSSKADAAHVEITRWERAIPIYNSELKNAQNSLQTGFCALPGKIVFGNFSKEVSIRSLINASLHV